MRCLVSAKPTCRCPNQAYLQFGAYLLFSQFNDCSSLQAWYLAAENRSRVAIATAVVFAAAIAHLVVAGPVDLLVDLLA